MQPIKMPFSGNMNELEKKIPHHFARIKGKEIKYRTALTFFLFPSFVARRREVA